MMVPEWLRGISNAKYICLVILLYFSLSIPLLLTWPPPMIDEALFGSTAKTLLDDGRVGTSLVRGLESHAYWQPPVYFFALVPAIEVGGFNLVTLRVFSVLVGAGIILLVFVLALSLGGPLVAKLAALLLAFDPHFVNSVKFVRMDGLCVLFVLTALAMLLIPTFERRVVNRLLAGVIAALAAFTHPVGVVAVIIFTFWILWDSSLDIRERLKGVLLLLVPLLIGAILWGFWILQDIPGFTEQMSYQLARKDRPLVLTIANTIKHYGNVPLALALPLVSLVFFLPRAFRKRGSLGLLTLLLGAILLVVIPKFEIPYHVYIAPLGAIVAAVLLAEFWRTTSVMKRSLAVLCSGLWFLNCLLVFGFLKITFHSTLASETDYDGFCKEVSTYLPAGAKVCGWGTPCIYWGLDKERPDVQFRDRAFIDSAKANDIVREIGYLVLSRGFTPGQDEVGLKKQHDTFSELCSMNQRQLMHVATVGKKLKYAYSADIYKVIPLTGQ